MNKFINLFDKKYLVILIGIFFLSISSIETHYHDENYTNHSQEECHFCINDLFDDNIDIPSKTLFLSDLSSFKNLDNFIPQFYTTFHSRAPPKI